MTSISTDLQQEAVIRRVLQSLRTKTAQESLIALTTVAVSDIQNCLMKTTNVTKNAKDRETVNTNALNLVICARLSINLAKRKYQGPWETVSMLINTRVIMQQAPRYMSAIRNAIKDYLVVIYAIKFVTIPVVRGLPIKDRSRWDLRHLAKNWLRRNFHVGTLIILNVAFPKDSTSMMDTVIAKEYWDAVINAQNSAQLVALENLTIIIVKNVNDYI